jgi:hypothetical protein
MLIAAPAKKKVETNPNEYLCITLIQSVETDIKKAATVRITFGFARDIISPRIIRPQNPPRNWPKGSEAACATERANIPEISGSIDPSALKVMPPVNSSRYKRAQGTFPAGTLSLFCFIISLYD